MTADPLAAGAWLAPLHEPSMRLLVSWDGLALIDESSRVLSAKGIESYDPKARATHAGQVTAVLDNTDRRFDPDFAGSPIHSYLTHAGQRAEVHLGWNGRLVRQGTYWARSIAPSDGGDTATLVLDDAIGVMAKNNVKVTYGPSGGVGLDDAVTSILTQAGLVPGSTCLVDAAVTTMVYGSCSSADALAELAQICFAEDGRLYADPDGLVRWENGPSHRAKLLSPVCEVWRSSSVYDMVRRRAVDILVNRVTLDFRDRYPSASPVTVYRQVNPILLAAAAPYTVAGLGETWWSFPGISLSIAAYVPGELRVPAGSLAISSIAANTAPDGSGTAMTMVNAAVAFPNTAAAAEVHYTATFSGGTGTVVLQNRHDQPVYVTALEITGTPSSIAALYRVSVDDSESQALYGEVVEEIVPSNYLPDLVTARARAASHLFSLAGTGVAIDVPGLDGLPFLHAQDTILFMDDRDGLDEAHFLQVIEHDWSFDASGYKSALKTVPSLPTSSLIEYELVRAPAMSVAEVMAAWPSEWDGFAWSEGAWA